VGHDAGVDEGSGTLSMGYAAIYIPELPTLAWIRLQADRRAAPAAVVEGTPSLERIVSFNRAAKALGLEHGMSKVQADTSGQVEDLAVNAPSAASHDIHK
jgi:protein ImuB